MARPVRIEYKGACYHIVARGIERRKILLASENKLLFLEILAEVKKTHGLTVHGYCLMDNHYHLQMETPRGNLVRAMTRLQGNFSIKYNAENRRSGHVFEGRYKAYLIDKVNYLLDVNRYIGLNPVRAGIVERPEEYEWSSYRAYVRLERDGLVDSDWILSRFSRKRGEAIRQYREFVMEKAADDKYDPFQKLYGGYILGDERFVKRIKKRYGARKMDEEVSERKYLRPRIAAREIERRVKEKFGADAKLGRKAAICLLRKYTEMPVKEIGELYRVRNYKAVTMIVSRNGEKLARDERFQSIERDLEEVINRR